MTYSVGVITPIAQIGRLRPKKIRKYAQRIPWLPVHSAAPVSL